MCVDRDGTESGTDCGPLRDQTVIESDPACSCVIDFVKGVRRVLSVSLNPYSN